MNKRSASAWIAGLAVLERHVEEGALLGRDGWIVFSSHCFLCEYECHGIAGEGSARATVHVSRELIENNDFGEAAPRLDSPLPKLAMVRGLSLIHI